MPASEYETFIGAKAVWEKLRLNIRQPVCAVILVVPLFVHGNRKVQCRQCATHASSLRVAKLLVAASILRNTYRSAHCCGEHPQSMHTWRIIYTFLRKPRHRRRHKKTVCKFHGVNNITVIVCQNDATQPTAV